MSRFDDHTYQTRIEKEQQTLPTSAKIKNETLKEFPREFVNIPTETVGKLMHMSDEEKQKFEYAVNKQEFVTDEFFQKGKFFTEDLSQTQKIEFVLQYIKEKYGVITPKVFKELLEKLFHLEDEGLTEEDYKEMFFDNFKKYQIDLENQKDKEQLMKILSVGEMNTDAIREEDIKLEQKEQQKQSIFVLPSALNNEVIIEEDQPNKKEQKELRVAQLA